MTADVQVIIESWRAESDLWHDSGVIVVVLGVFGGAAWLMPADVLVVAVLKD